MLHDSGSPLRLQIPAKMMPFFDEDAAVCLTHRCGHSGDIEGLDCAKIDEFGIDAFFGQLSDDMSGKG